VSPELAASYGAIIEDILASSDLNSISAKQVRKQLGQKLGSDLSKQKVCAHLVRILSPPQSKLTSHS